MRAERVDACCCEYEDYIISARLLFIFTVMLLPTDGRLLIFTKRPAARFLFGRCAPFLFTMRTRRLRCALLRHGALQHISFAP